jgi:hypothetical protein
MSFSSSFEAPIKLPKVVVNCDTKIRRLVLRGVMNSHWDKLCFDGKSKQKIKSNLFIKQWLIVNLELIVTDDDLRLTIPKVKRDKNLF